MVSRYWEEANLPTHGSFKSGPPYQVAELSVGLNQNSIFFLKRIRIKVVFYLPPTNFASSLP